MCFLFDSANHVRAIEKLQAPGDDAARSEAARRTRSRTRTVGYELWKDGHKLHSFFFRDRIAVGT